MAKTFTERKANIERYLQRGKKAGKPQPLHPDIGPLKRDIDRARRNKRIDDHFSKKGR